MKVDAVIVGARCAGAATALLLARAGARVVVVDRGVYGSDTTSTHALMRGGVLQLQRWGVLPAIVAAGTPPVQQTTFSYPDEDVTVAIEPKAGVSALYAPRRALLDRVLVDAAAASGADVRYGALVDDVIRDDRGRVCGIVAADNGRRLHIEAGIVIGADGLYSTIAQRVGADVRVRCRHAGGVLYSYWLDLPVDGYYWRFDSGTGMGAIPTNDGATCVFGAVPASGFRATVAGHPASAYRRLLRQAAPAFEPRLAAARQVEPVRGFGGHPGFIRQSVGPGWALVGDAAYFKDPITAHGITDALRDAELLARAITQGTAAAFADYEATQLNLSQRLLEVTDEIASFAWSSREVKTLHRDFSREMSKEVQALAALEALPQPAVCR